MKTRKKPYTARELFWEIHAGLEEKGSLPSSLEYGIPSGKEDRRILTHFWDMTFKVRFGSSEGIYLDLYLSGEPDGSGEAGDYLIGTFKTLEEDDESFRQMALLGADFSLETVHWLNGRLDDFTWTGYDVAFLLGGEEKHRMTCYDSLEKIMSYLPAKAEYIRHDSIMITENASGHVVFHAENGTLTGNNPKTE